MVKNKNARITITLECVDCTETVGRRIGKNRITHRYVTQKNRHNTPGRLEVRKFCPYCRTHRIYREILKK